MEEIHEVCSVRGPRSLLDACIHRSKHAFVVAHVCDHSDYGSEFGRVGAFVEEVDSNVRGPSVTFHRTFLFEKFLERCLPKWYMLILNLLEVS